MVEIISKECINWAWEIEHNIKRYSITTPTKILAGEDGIVFCWVKGPKYLEFCCHYNGTTTFLSTDKDWPNATYCETLLFANDILPILLTLKEIMETSNDGLE